MFSSEGADMYSPEFPVSDQIDLDIELSPGQLEVLKYLNAPLNPAIKEIAGIQLDSGIVSVRVGSVRVRIDTARNSFHVIG
jgi:hypothetical protein